jgi:hypothetical protein
MDVFLGNTALILISIVKSALKDTIAYLFKYDGMDFNIPKKNVLFFNR